MKPDLLSMLSPLQWALLALVPPAIIALYFLKLKRKPLEVPSTFLWHKSIEDLHVNSIWQRLRRNLLLLLQLLVLLLVALALLRPSWKGSQLSRNRFIFLVDNSASMQATDQQGSRLDEAKRQVAELIDRMKAGDVAMIVSFSDGARVEQMFTTQQKQLHRSLAKIRPTQGSTNLREALKVASGLANPGRTSEAQNAQDVQVAEALPADVYIFSDGKFPSVADFSLGHLKPIYRPIGKPEAANVAIAAFDVRESEATPGLIEAYARLVNFGPEPVNLTVEVFLDDRSVNVKRLHVAAGEEEGVTLDLGAVRSGVLKLVADCKDDLSLDNVAHVVIGPPRRAQVLVVTSGSEPLDFALHTGSVVKTADVLFESPKYLQTKEYRDAAGGGIFDLIIYDRCAPGEMPQANTMLIGRLPPGDEWSAKPEVARPIVINTKVAHPLLAWVDLVGDVDFAAATPLQVPPAGSVLVDADEGPLMAIAPRGRFEDLVLGFVMFDEVAGEDGKTDRYVGTNWSIRPSFAMFMVNLLGYLGGSRGAEGSRSFSPGTPVTLESPTPEAKLQVRTPSGRTVKLAGGRLGRYDFTDTTELGVYRVSSGGKTHRRFAVNLFDDRESSLKPEPEVEIGWVKVEAKSDWEVARREIWKWLLLAGLAVLLVEWYMYNRRVYL